MTEQADRQEQQKREKLQEKNSNDELRELLMNPLSRRALARLVAGTGVFRSSMTGNSETFALEGERRVGLRIINIVEHVAPGVFKEFLSLTKEFTDG